MGKRIIFPYGYSTDFENAMAELERTIQFWVDKGFSLAGNLTYVKDGDWHHFIQPMIGEKDTAE